MLKHEDRPVHTTCTKGVLSVLDHSGAKNRLSIFQ